jgi:hypothetical protein
MWPNLRMLAVAHNSIAALPDSLTSLTALSALLAGKNQLAHLPAGLTALERLTVLCVGGNQLAALPPGLAGLTGLTDLDLSSNQLSPGSLEATLLLALTVLTSLRLADNAALFDEATVAIDECSGRSSSTSAVVHAGEPQLLSWFAAWLDGDFRVATASVQPSSQRAALPRLRALDVSGTGLRRLPAWLPPGLAELAAARNHLDGTLPATLCSRLAGSLRFLDLRGNARLLRAPGQQLAQLTGLRALALVGCPCCVVAAAGVDVADAGRWWSTVAGSPAAGDVPLEGSGVWAAGWLAAHKCGRQWPPPRRRPQQGALRPRESCSAGPPFAGQQPKSCVADHIPTAVVATAGLPAAAAESGGTDAAAAPAAFGRRRAAIFAA